jgi:hypothetical protein
MFIVIRPERIIDSKLSCSSTVPVVLFCVMNIRDIMIV